MVRDTWRGAIGDAALSFHGLVVAEGDLHTWRQVAAPTRSAGAFFHCIEIFSGVLYGGSGGLQLGQKGNLNLPSGGKINRIQV
jgi:hypothetical protein